MLILNTGGTFNKRYNPVNGELFVSRDEMAIEKIVATLQINMRIQGILHKDSLEMDNEDRATLCENIVNAKEDIVIIVHGTDTMELSAQAVRELNLGKRVVFTGAMIPFAIDPLEATANLAMAIGYAKHAKNGVYIVMQGVCGEYDTIIKNKVAGKFEYV